MEYPDGVKARMVRRMVGPDAVSATSLATETGISQATFLDGWRLASSA
jgi:transposase-like protein